MMNNLGKKENLLDISTGTGKVLLTLAKHFTKTVVGNDASAKQLEVAIKKAAEQKLDIKFLECDSYDLRKRLDDQKITEKFDVITIAQALHWFDIYKFNDYVARELLAENGNYFVLSYFCRGFTYNMKKPTEDLDKKAWDIYDVWYKKLKPFFPCDRDILAVGFKTIDFSKAFKKKQLFEETVEISEMTFETLIGYLRTASGYNMYVEKFKSQPDFIDPVQQVYEIVKADLTAIGEDNLKDVSKPILIHMHYAINQLQ